MKTINSWKSIYKNKDRIEIKFRIGYLTIFELFFDLSDKKVRLMILNLGIETGK